MLTRKDLLGRENAATLAELHSRARSDSLPSSPTPPHLVVLVDGYQAFQAAYAEIDRGEMIDRFASYVAEGRAVGIHFVIAADRARGIPGPLSSAIANRLILRLAEPDEYLWLGVPQARSTHFVPGRGIADGGLECQIAAPGDSPTNEAQVAAIATLASALPIEPAAEPVVRAPELVRLDSLPPATSDAVPVGIDAISLAPLTVHLDYRPIFVVAGPDRSGRSTALITLATGWTAAHPDAERFLFAPARSPLREATGLRWTKMAISSDAAAELARELTNRVSPGGDLAGQPVLVVIDDGDRMTDASLATALDPFVRRARDSDVVLLVGVASRAVARTFSGWLRELREAKHGLLLSPDPDIDSEVFSTRLPRKATRRFPPGRGYLIDRDRLVYAQAAVCTEPEIKQRGRY